MTLGEGKRKVLMLLDEYSVNGVISVDEDIDAKMNDFFDMAQKDLARTAKIVKLFTPEETETELPEDCLQVVAVWRGGHKWSFVRKGNVLTVPAGAEIEYVASPATITPDTPDSYAFEVSDNAAQALPYYVAAQHLIPDLMLDYGRLWAIYIQMKNELAQSGNASAVRNVLFR